MYFLYILKKYIKNTLVSYSYEILDIKLLKDVLLVYQSIYRGLFSFLDDFFIYNFVNFLN